VRSALNENPVVQAALIGLLAIAVAFLLMTRVLNSDSQGGAADPAAPSPTAAATVDASAATAPAPAAGAPEGQTAAAAAATPATDFVAGPGLPANVVDAYEDGSAIVLLVTRKAGIEDKRLRAIVGQARGVGNVAVFTTNAHGIARYSRIAGGVDVSRVPALVVIRPHKFHDAVPTASVSYGFRGPESVKQAVRDALYEGKSNLPYYPQ
jgi:hypothetical protein